ncbi:MAG: hypothetical protein A2Y12_14560 [Planctomycetes bacterium GWF2_42_9]|nr:MAG: hypothetical protein A2Y12_14560 [Planctomycetes bacterium GWF2_42_9]HAL45879.1 hypothetical protein [Phycisphaerales bacterium]
MKVIASLVLFTICSTTISAELLTNTGFESNMTGWTVSSSNGSVASSTTANSGSKSTKFETTDYSSPYSAYIYASQSVAYDNSTEYTFSIYARDNWSNGGQPMANAVTLRIEYYNASSTLLRADQQLFSLPKDYLWHQYTFTSTQIPAGTAIVKPVFGTTQDSQWQKSVLFDDASLTGVVPIVQEPHTGDLNGDLFVNFSDYSQFANGWQISTDEVDLYDIADNWLAEYCEPLAIVSTLQTVQQYSPVFFDINSVSAFSNPYNPDDISIDIIFHSPDNSQITLPCFYVSGNSSASKWQGRFTPQQTGQYSYQAKVYVNGVYEGYSPISSLTVTESSGNGFIHKNPDSYYFWKYDSGKAFRGIGENVAWDTRSYNNQMYPYEYMLPMLGNQGCNFVRIWLCEWNMPLEWDTLGRYTASASQRLDAVFALAEQNGISLLLTLNTYSEFKSIKNIWGTGDDWVRNPYNVTKGGPCATAASFFSNATAKNFYKKKLRYFIARWGYHTNLGVIEFFNEVDHLYADGDASVPAADIVSWHDEMSTYLKSIDPFKHLVTTSFSYKWMPDLWNVSNLDFTQTHPYGTTDNTYSTITSFENNFSKPYVMEEFGYSWESAGTSSNHYLFRRELHMGMWRGMFSPTPVLPMVWWWENLAYYNDWDVFAATANFSNQITADSDGFLTSLAVNAGTGMEAMGVQTIGRMYVWLRNKTSSTISSATLTISGVQNGTYEVAYYNTWLGTYSSPSTITVTGGVLSAPIPSLTADGDMAFRIVKTGI